MAKPSVGKSQEWEISIVYSTKKTKGIKHLPVNECTDLATAIDDVGDKNPSPKVTNITNALKRL